MGSLEADSSQLLFAWVAMGGAESALPTGPEDPHTSATGELFLYNEEFGLSAFEFGRTEGSRRWCALRGSLTAS